jgi:hypothetical protein
MRKNIDIPEEIVKDLKKMAIDAVAFDHKLESNFDSLLDIVQPLRLR